MIIGHLPFFLADHVVFFERVLVKAISTSVSSTAGISHRDHFPDVMCDRQRGKLCFDEPFSLVMEALEAAVVFDLSEDGFRFYRAHAPVV